MSSERRHQTSYGEDSVNDELSSDEEARAVGYGDSVDSEVENDEDSHQAQELQSNIKRFQEGMNNAKSREEEQNVFRLYERYVRPPSSEKVKKAVEIGKRNVLYNLTLRDDSKLELTWLVKLLAEEHPELVDEEDDSESSALVWAIRTKKLWFIHAVLDSNLPKERLQKMLGATTDEEEIDDRWKRRNCIREAIIKGIEPATTIRLINAASKYTLGAIDPDGLTPLHYAVQDSKCARKRLGVIEALIQHGDRAFDQRTRDNGFSVYRYHYHTRKKVEKKSQNRKPAEEMTAPTSFDTSKMTAQLQSSGHPTNGNHSSKSSNVSDDVAEMLKLHYLRTTFRSGTVGQTNEYVGLKGRPRNLDSAVEFLFGDNSDHKLICFDFPAALLYKKQIINFETFEGGYKGFNFDSVLLYVNFGPLELQTVPLSERGPRDALKPKAGTGRRDLSKFFDWLHKEKNVRRIIKVTVEDGSSMEKELIPHCDESIIESLNKFSIEILDWRKIDLCPLVIQLAGEISELRGIHLRWSGSNAILRSWSEVDGLPQLKTLEWVQLHCVKARARTDVFQCFLTNNTKEPLDSPKWVISHVDAFVTRLNSSREKDKKIEVKFHRFDSHRLQGSSMTEIDVRGSNGITQSKDLDEHRWLTIMDKFADGVSGLGKVDWFPQNYLTDLNLPEALRRDVTVALIDDGVDHMQEVLVKNLGCGVSFNDSNDEHDVNGAKEPYHVSASGHGTLMAYMIRRICPSVKFLVCKLDVQRHDRRDPTFTPRSAVAAVKYAIKEKVDIISMSWSVLRNETDKQRNTEDLLDLQTALAHAAKKDILLFCSAPDVGSINHTDLYYPFGCSDLTKMFRIGAATADGTIASWAGYNYNVDFILPGEKVGVKKQDRSIRLADGGVLKTGSSIATALAAGLAALIIHCVRLGAVYNSHRMNRAIGPDANLRKNVGVRGMGVTEQTLKVVKTHKAMMQAFREISSKNTSGSGDKDPRLGVETFFPVPGDTLANSTLNMEAKWAQVERLARNLVSDNMESTCM